MADEVKPCPHTLRRCLEIANRIRRENAERWRLKPSHSNFRERALGVQLAIDAIQKELGNAAQS